jgi:uncharacterized protein YjbI with pentapeptide repeats
MANKEQLALLRKGVEVWNNQWETGYRIRKIELQGANLSGAKLRGIDLRYANLQDANLRGTDLQDAKLWGAKLQQADLRGAFLQRINLEGANLEGANLQDAKIQESKLGRANFSNANLRKSRLEGADFQKGSLISANLQEANLQEVNLYQANLQFSNLQFASLLGAYLKKAQLHGADLYRAKLLGANLEESELPRANLKEADLRGANLFKTQLMGACLQEINLRAANLREANLYGADCQGANFRIALVLAANFTSSTLTGACIADWQIGSSTILTDVTCDYVFRTVTGEDQFSGRLPTDPNNHFAPGEFELWAEIRASALETIDLTFLDVIDWQNFFKSLQDVRLQNPNTGIFLQGVEEREGRYVVRLRVETEKTGKERELLEARIETTTKELYETRRQLDEARGEIKALDRSLEKALSRPTYDFRYSQWAGGFAENVFGNQSGGTLYTHTAPERQMMIGAIAEVLALLQQLGQTNPTATLEEQTAFINMAIPPNRRERLLWVFQSVGEAALQELPYSSVIKAIIEGWQEPG